MPDTDDIYDLPHTLLCACARGVAPLLRRELEALGFPITAELDAGVETEGTLRDAMRLNLLLRTAIRVQVQVRRFRALNPVHLYRHTRKVRWERYIAPDAYITITSWVRTPSIQDDRFANLKVKDGIVDTIRARHEGARPDAGNARDGVVIFLYWQGEDCALYIETSGEPLSRRGYRQQGGEAPMQESLAAAVVLETGWDRKRPFINPMCGSGTLAIEAALLAKGVAPGLQRSGFAMQYLKDFPQAEFDALRAELAAVTPPAPDKRPIIIATDRDPQAIAMAKANAERAGVADMIDFHICDFADTPLPEIGRGVVVLNPPYGERLNDDDDLDALYGGIGDFFKQRCAGYTGYVFTANLPAAKRLGLRSIRRVPFYNGKLECRLLAYDIYEGTKDP